MDQPGNTWTHCLEQASLSDVGLHRANNQDSCVIALADNQADFEERGHFFMVADGMGAHAAGELASKMATDIVSMVYRKRLDRLPSEAILSALINANHQIHTRGLASPDFRGMGTTATALLMLPAGVLLAHVGDSRAYRWRNHRIEQLTFDHSLVWEMRATGQYPNGELPGYISKNIITRSLGPRLAVKVDLEGPHPTLPGDVFLLCSDGLSNQIKDEEIGAILGCLPPHEAVQALVDIANLRGGPDNITVVVAKVLGPQVAQNSDEKSLSHKSYRPRYPVHPAIWTLIGVALLMTAGLLALEYYLPALLCFLCAGVGGIAAFLQSNGGSFSRASLENLRFGQGPYVQCDCTPQLEFLEIVNDFARRLRENAAQSGHILDDKNLEEFQQHAMEAKTDGRFADALRDSLHAIMLMMTQLRRQHDISSEVNEILEEEEEDEEEEKKENKDQENKAES